MANLNQSYDFIKQIGVGGMATVFLGRHPALERLVAIKVVKGEQKDKVRRFEREARLSATLKQENLPAIFDYFTDDQNNHYLVMEYVDGVDISPIIKSKTTIPPMIVAMIAREVCRGLEHMHENGIIHRDIKPSNVRLGKNGQVKLMDFGIAKHEEDAGKSHLTATGVIVGTPSYMSPEQASGDQLTPQSDVYSLGIMMYEMLTGKKPYTADTNMTLISLIAQGKFTPLSETHPHLPPALVDIVHRAMVKSLRQRYATTSEIIKDLNKYLQSMSQIEIRDWLVRYYDAATTKDKIVDMNVFVLPAPVSVETAETTTRLVDTEKNNNFVLNKRHLVLGSAALVILCVLAYLFWPSDHPLGNYDPYGRLALSVRSDRQTIKDTRVYVNDSEFPLDDNFGGSLIIDNLQPGRNAIKIRFPLLYHTYEYNFTLDGADESKALNLDLTKIAASLDGVRPESRRYGFAVISEPAGVSVHLDDLKSKPLGKSPTGLIFPSVKTGLHKIFLQKEGYVTSAIERNFTPDQNYTLQYELEPAKKK
ncbi:protein kinase [bacterium]|nr:protein kinase [bacterium]